MSLVTGAGLTGGLHTTLPVAMTISAFTAIAWCNSLELNVRIWIAFKRHSGLYFWSLQVASWGVIIYSLAFIIKFFQVIPNNYISVAAITIGWWSMVTGQSLVLYSRLHLIMRDGRRIRWVLYMIIIDAILFHIPTTVLTFGSNSSSPEKFTTAYGIMEKIQLTAFSIQEFIISAIYVYETRRILKPGEIFQKNRFRQVMKHLIYINILLVVLDITLLATEYANLYVVQITMKGAVYGFKLRLEFAILNQLMSILRSSDSSHSHPNSHSHSAHRDVKMDTFQGRSAVHNTQNGQHTSNTYSFFIGKSKTEAESQVLDKSGVVKTTEVTINTSEVVRDDDQDSQNEAGDTVNPHSRVPRGPNFERSPSSSEIGLAQAGA